jgi:two-component system response regulator (stage 0 sporulation protein A)
MENIKESLREKLLNSEYKFTLTGDDGNYALDTVRKAKPELVVVNMFLRHIDGCEVIRMIKRELPNIKIIATGVASEKIIEQALTNGADYYLVKPFSEDILLERISGLLNQIERYEVATPTYTKKSNFSVEGQISDIFIAIGIPAHIKGYQYLREGIKVTVEDPKIINSVTKKLYPVIAEKYDTTPSKVERAIRHAINVAWGKARIDAINAIFGSKIYLGTEKPTNSEFIALIADKIMLERML